MIYSADNVTLPCRVYDVDAKQEIRRVMEINPSAGWVKVSAEPLRARGSQIVGERIRFRSIYPIYGGRIAPVMFHCYGRLHAKAPNPQA